MLLFKVFNITINHRQHRNCLENDKTLTWLLCFFFYGFEKKSSNLKMILEYDGGKSTKFR